MQNIVYIVIIPRETRYIRQSLCIITVLSHWKLLLCKEVKWNYIIRIGKRSAGLSLCQWYNFCKQNRKQSRPRRMIIVSGCVCESRNGTPNVSPWFIASGRGICSLSEYLIFVMRMNHGREVPLARPRCDYMVSVTYTRKESRTLYTAAYY